jgi:uncharacterized protein (DUF3820 family)
MTYNLESGMYKGRRIDDVPSSYLHFLVRNVGASKVGKLAQEEIARRKQPIKGPVMPFRCKDGRHFESLLLYGNCHSCSSAWGLSGIKENEPAIKRYENLKAARV